MMATATRRTFTALGALAAVIAISAIAAGSASAAAELQSFELTRSSAQAGGHPDIYMKAGFRTKNQEAREAQEDPTKYVNECYCADPRQFSVHFPTGFIGNPHAIPICTLAQLGLKKCPPDSQVGIASALFGEQFLYNMEPRPGEPGLLASQIPLLGTPVFTILRARTDSDYGLDATTPDIFHLIGLEQVQFWIWGVPTDPVHNIHRAPLDEQVGCFKTYPEPCFSAPTPATTPPSPYLQNPTSCGGPPTASIDAVYYNHETVHGDYAWVGTTGCDLLAFSPSLVANPTTSASDTPTGIDIIARVPQTQSPTVPSPSEVKSVSITLPEGFSVNPNAADGKTSCTNAMASLGTLAAAVCPQTAKVGTLSLDSSALPAPIEGAMYLGQPLPGERYRLVLAADGFETHVKLVGSVDLDPQSGQITVRFENLPQSPLQEFDLHIFGAERGLMATPVHCGTYTMESEFVPWAEELGAQNSSASFTIDSGPNGAPCPGAARPHNPSLLAGSPDNTAGSFSPLAVKIDRRDGDQNLSNLNVITPPGFLASLKGVPYCPEAALAQLSSPDYMGQAEQASPACPAASLVGTSSTSAGAGSRPIFTPGKVYLAGPYKGAPVSLAIVTPAVSGPYDLGNVMVRAGAFVNPINAQVTTVSDPLPRILDGIPLRLRSVLVNLDRPDFALNPTNCSPFSIATAIFGDEGGQANPAAFYQVANCTALAFGPRLNLNLVGGVKRRGHPAIRAVLQAAPGESNIKSVQVTLPKGELLDNSHIGTICTRVDLARDACPEASIYGSAVAVTPLLDVPLRGNVYLGASSNKLPDLVIDLKGQIDVQLSGRIDSANSALRASFETVPDAPITSFELNLAGGSKGLLINSESLCGVSKKAQVSMVGQNGVGVDSRSKLKTTCSSKARHKRHQGARKAGKGR